MDWGWILVTFGPIMAKGNYSIRDGQHLKCSNPAHAAAVDQLEAGERVSGPIRFAFQVPDVHAAVKNALDYGGHLVHEPVLTPWNDLNARVTAPDGMQITLFQAMGEPD
jgi:hypothetical protein